MAGRILAGRYELLEKIGEGGMAVVFKARDRLLNRMVAIKILRPEYTRDAVFVASFRKESQVAAGLVHPNIVNVYDVGKEGNIHYIVMELIEGEPLSEIIKHEGKLDPYRAASIAKQVASALSTAHKHQLIHRDVKPHNIMITRDGVAKITDFGIAKAVTTDTLVGEQKEAVMGSVHYFSPEQARGGYVDERSDIYSLGIVLYEMLTGEVPFDGDSAVEVAVKQINEEMPHPTDIDPEIPADLEEIILKATQKLQTNRYKSADDMITALNFVKFSSRHPMVDSANAVAAANAARGITDEVQDEYDEVYEEIENRGEKKKKGSSKPRYKIPASVQRLIAFALAVLLALPLSNFAFKLIYKAAAELDPSSTSAPTQTVNPIQTQTAKTVAVPNLSGKTLEEAEAALKDIGLKLDIDLELPSDTVEAGVVLSQNPDAGTGVKEGYTVKVNVSKGKVDGKVPNVVGKTQSSAESMIKSYGYKVGGGGSTFSDVIPKGCVVSQSPEAGSSLADGGTIAIIISAGPENPQVGEINVVGLTLDEAKALIEGKGLTVGGVTYTENAYAKEGTVISQDPEASHEFAEGEVVNLVVCQSGGGQGGETAEKKSVQILVDYSPADEEVFYLTVHVHDSVNGTSVAYQQVEKSRDMGAEFITVSGNGEDGTVVVMFNNVTVYQYSVDFEHGQYY